MLEYNKDSADNNELKNVMGNYLHVLYSVLVCAYQVVA